MTFASVLYGEKLKEKQKNAQKEDFNYLEILVMGRKLTLPMFIATLVATWYGGIFGVTSIAFKNGIYNFVTQGVFWYITYIIFAVFMVDHIAKYQAVTLPDLISKMFGKKSSYLSAGFNFFNVLPIAYLISLGLFLKILFNGSLLFNMTIGLFIVLLYATFGGIRAVIFSDFIQFFVMCFGVLLVLIFSIGNYGGISFLKSNLPSSYFSITGTHTLSETLIWGFIALSTLVDPNFYQRCFATNSPRTAKKGIIISTIVWLCFDICTTFGAMYAKATIPNASPDNAYLIYSIQLLPPGLRGFFIAGILATILSTLDSYLFLAGTTISFDIFPKQLRNKSFLHHFGIIISGLLALFMANIFNGDIKAVWKTLGSYSASCLLLPVLFGYIFPKRISDNQFFCSSIVGIISTTTWKIIDKTSFIKNIDELYIGIIATGTTLALFSIFNKIKPSASS